MIICRSKNIRSMGIRYIVSRPLLVLGVAAYIIACFVVFDLISAKIANIETILVLFAVFTVLLFNISIFLNRKLKDKFMAFLIIDDKIYITNIIKSCFRTYTVPSALGTIILILSLSNIIPLPFALSFGLFVISLLFNVFNNIRCALIMYRTATDEYIDRVVSSSEAEFAVEKVIDVKKYGGGTKIRFRLRKLKAEKGEWFKTVRRTFNIPDDYENADCLLQQLDLII
ncbi:MAG: hypothetical protein NC320_00040 [Clostridium sp.]|nr:hypothetical protein [Clostridium sp.]MCM1546731.1 hypothetical protein [Ruminococcus sp.]